MDNNRKTITITLTESCNLNCVYCYEKNKSDNKIDISLAKQIIDYEIDNMKEYDEIEFDLFGGEPFLAFDLLKDISEYIQYACNKKNIPYIIFITTNGTLVHGKIQKWLLENLDYVKCGVSLDGNREMHNYNRSMSFETIDLDFFLNNYPEQDVKMTISQESLKKLAEGVIFLHDFGFKVSCNLAYQIDWGDDANKKILERELQKLIDYYIEHPEIEPCSMLDIKASNIGAKNNDKSVRFCGAGNEVKAYDVNGEVYPCQFFMPLSIGKEKAEMAKKIIFPTHYIEDCNLDDKCKECVIKSACPNCYGSNFASSGSIFSRDSNMCKLTKIIMMARTYLFSRKWKAGVIDEEDEDLINIMNSVVLIQNELKLE